MPDCNGLQSSSFTLFSRPRSTPCAPPKSPTAPPRLVLVIRPLLAIKFSPCCFSLAVSFSHRWRNGRETRPRRKNTKTHSTWDNLRRFWKRRRRLKTGSGRRVSFVSAFGRRIWKHPRPVARSPSPPSRTCISRVWSRLCIHKSARPIFVIPKTILHNDSSLKVSRLFFSFLLFSLHSAFSNSFGASCFALLRFRATRFLMAARLKKLEQQVDSLVRVERTVSLAPGNWLDGREVGGYPMPHSRGIFLFFVLLLYYVVFFFFTWQSTNPQCHPVSGSLFRCPKAC